MYKPRLIIAIILLLFTFGCNHDQYRESRDILKESISIHDEVMPKMGEIMSLQKKLKILLSNSKENPQKADEINKAITNLESAHEDMMNWMRHMEGIPDDHDHNHHEVQDHKHQSPDEVLAIQKAQRDQIVKVKDDIVSSIENAKKLLP